MPWRSRALAQQELGQPVPRASDHQGHPHEHEPDRARLPDPMSALTPPCTQRAERAGQGAPRPLTAVLTLSPLGRCNCDGATTSLLIPAAVRDRDRPNPVGACLVRKGNRPWRIAEPGSDWLVRWGHSGLDELARDAVDRCSNDRTRVHVEPTLGRSVNTGASHECRIGRAGSPRSVTHESRERGPGPQPLQDDRVVAYRLDRPRAAGARCIRSPSTDL